MPRRGCAGSWWHFRVVVVVGKGQSKRHLNLAAARPVEVWKVGTLKFAMLNASLYCWN